MMRRIGKIYLESIEGEGEHILNLLEIDGYAIVQLTKQDFEIAKEQGKKPAEKCEGVKGK